jgi:nucleoside-diphosphate-sugar epimerase
MKTALVLGAGGFIGSHLTQNLVSDNYYVCGVDIKENEFRKSCANDFIVGDLRDQTVVESIFQKHTFDEVYQLACDMGGATYINSGEHDADVMSNSVLINANVAKMCVKYGAKRLFFSSSACVYPQTGKDYSSCLEDTVYPAKPDNNYGWEKLFSEIMYKNFQKQYGLIVRIARFHSIVGEYSTWCGGKEKAHSALARKVSMVEENGTIEIIGDGKQLRTFLHVSDCVCGIRTLMNSDCEEIINIGSDYTITILDYVELLKKISGKNFTIKCVDGFTGVHERGCNIEKARTLISWEPKVSLEESTRLTYDWITSELAKRPNVLFITQSIGKDISQKAHCGIGIRGKLTSTILKKSLKYNFVQCFVDNIESICSLIDTYKPEVIIYNYHFLATSWLPDPFTNIMPWEGIKHLFIHYDMTQRRVDECVDIPNYIITDDDTLIGNPQVFVVARSMPFVRSTGSSNKSSDEKHIPKIGFQGFCGSNKGIEKLAHQVNSEFDEAILRLHMPFSHFGDPEGNCNKVILNKVRNIITKPGIQIEYSDNFMSDEDIVDFLAENDVNCYFYDYLDGSGIASSPDYAIMARKPIAITKSHMFRHMWDLTPSILIENSSLRAIIENGIAPLEPLYKKYNHEAVIKNYENIVEAIDKRGDLGGKK